MTTDCFQPRSAAGHLPRDSRGFRAVALPGRSDGIGWALRRAFHAEHGRLPDDMQHLLDQLR